jgi:Zn-dependent protease with chaperone function
MKSNLEEVRQPRLDPFVFPSETTLRFALLIVSVISVSLYIYSLFYWVYRDGQINFEPLDRLVDACISQGKTAASTPKSIDLFSPKALEDASKTAKALRNDHFIKCTEPIRKEVLNASWFAIGGVGILCSLASLLYSLFPVLMIWKEGLISLESQTDMQDIVVYLRDLCQEMGIRSPRFLLKPTSGAIGSRAFGALGRYYVVLPTGMLIQFDQNRDRFRAVMLHELSHLRNKDVDKIYFSVAISFAFVIAALVPFAFFSLGRSSGTDLFQVSWRVIALTLLVYLTFASVVRSREFYADVRASTYAGSEALDLHFQAAPTSKFSGLRAMTISTLERLPYFKRNRWQFAFLFHPDTSDRRQVLETTDRLFYFDIWAAFSTGIAVIVAYDRISILINNLVIHLSKDTATELAPLITGFVFAPLIVGIIGIGVWRRTFVTLIRNQHSAGVGKLGLALGLGMILGKGFPLGNAVSSLEYNFTLDLCVDVLLLVSFYYFFKWMATGALIWLQVAVSKRSPRPFYVAGLIIAGFCLALWLGVIWGLRSVDVLTTLNSFEALFSFVLSLPVLIQYLAIQPLTLIALASLWAFPLSACLWHKRQPDSTFMPRWGFLDQMPDQIHQPTQKRLEIYPALRAGLMGGLGYCGLLLVLRLGRLIFLPESVRNSEWAVLVFWAVGNLGLAVLMQTGIAMKVARNIQSFNKVHGLFAAFIAGCVMTISVLVLNLLFGGTIDAQFIWSNFSLIVNFGALLSLLGMMMVRLPKNRANISDSDVGFEG